LTRAALGMLLAALAAARPAGADPLKSVPVTLSGWRVFSGPPPAGWADPGFDDRSWSGPSPGPFVPERPGLLPGETPVTPYAWTRGQPLLLRARVQAADPARVRVLDLHVAYGDGFIAYLDGHEVARRGMAGSGTAAEWPHGPEVERVSIPLPGPGGARLAPGGSTLALAVFAAPVRSPVLPTVPAAAVEVGAASGVRLVRGPYLNARPDGPHGREVVVRWQTDLPARATIRFEQVGTVGQARLPRRVAGGRSRQVTAAATTDGALALSGLRPGAVYGYVLEVDAGHGDVASADGRFQTVPDAPAPLRFAVYGDMRYPGHEAHRAVVEALTREAPPLVFNTGDLTDLGSEESNWQKYFEITAPLGAIAPILPALGNHDGERRGAGGPITAALFGLPSPHFWTSVDYGGVHFVLLSTNEMTNMEQRDWLRADLARARARHARAIFAFCHEGPWSHALHGGSELMARVYAPILAAAHVDVLFSGHDHVYERGVGSTPAGKLTYVVTGGGGAPPYDPTCRAVSGPPPGDVPHPLRPCPRSVAALTKAYHYILVEVAPSGISLCPKRPDGSAVEPCVHLPGAH
jgi:predicted phosphodiesterase